jgi:uncharacterized protein YdhG (YjbR/CyaY superfamily)
MRTPPASVADYLSGVSPERRRQLERLRKLVKQSVPECEEGIWWGMIGYKIDGRAFAAMASHKSYLSLYLMDLYTQPQLRTRHQAALAPLKMGKSCINFDDLSELPLDSIADILRAAPDVVVAKGTMAGGKQKTASQSTKTMKTRKKKRTKKAGSHK